MSSTVLVSHVYSYIIVKTGSLKYTVSGAAVVLYDFRKPGELTRHLTTLADLQ